MDNVRDGDRGAIVIAYSVGFETRYIQDRRFAILASGLQTMSIAW